MGAEHPETTEDAMMDDTELAEIDHGTPEIWVVFLGAIEKAHERNPKHEVVLRARKHATKGDITVGTIRKFIEELGRVR